MNTPDENGILLGEFANQKSITLKDETPQNKSWYRVYGQTINGSYIDGWCQGYYLETEVKFKEWHGSGNINVRLETKTNTDTNIIGKLPPKGRLRLLEDNYTKNTHTWHKILYANRVAYIADQAKLSTKNYWIPLVRKDVGDTLTNEEIERILINIQRSAHISNSKKNGAVPFARIMLENNYEPVFVAGMLANIEKEANIGQLENSNYKTYPNEKPDYLKYMDTEYRDKNFYLNNYSNKKIMDAEMLILQKQILLN